MTIYIKQGERFLKECVFDGLAHSFDVKKYEYVKAYPEVTGYILNYFFDNSDEIPKNIMAAADYLLEIQDKTGGYYSFDRTDILYTFDTAQIARGLLSAYKNTGEEKYLEAAQKAGSFLLESQNGNGSFNPIYNCNINAWVIRDETYRLWNGPFSGLMCKITESLSDLYIHTGDNRFRTALDKAGDFYENAQYIEYTHPMGYWLEGLLAADRKGKIKSVIEEKILCRIHQNGYIPYSEKLPYAYVSGTIQLGVILYKMGYFDVSKRIRAYGRQVQSKHISGGLFQYANSHGELDQHIHSEINSWGTKYFCELERLWGDEDEK